MSCVNVIGSYKSTKELKGKAMPVMCQTELLVLSVKESTRSELARTALRNGWMVHEADSVTDAMREIRRRRSNILVIQVSLLAESALELIHTLRCAGMQVTIIAVAISHYPELERTARMTGCHAYVADISQRELLEAFVEQASEVSEPQLAV